MIIVIMIMIIITISLLLVIIIIIIILIKGNAQFVEKVNFKPSGNFKQNHYIS